MTLRSLPKAVLLDFYGTVVEEDEVLIGEVCAQIAEASALTVTPAEVGMYWWQVMGRMCSESYGDAFRSQREIERLSLECVLERFEADLDSGALSQVLYAYWRCPAIFAESRKVVRDVTVPICLVSNIDNADLASALRHVDLSFDFVVTSEECRAYKPRGDMFERALSLLGLSAGEVIHVGDSLGSDVRGAKSQGIPVLWINRRNRNAPDGQEAPDYAARDLTGLLDVLRGAAQSAQHG